MLMVYRTFGISIPKVVMVGFVSLYHVNDQWIAEIFVLNILKGKFAWSTLHRSQIKGFPSYFSDRPFKHHAISVSN